MSDKTRKSTSRVLAILLFAAAVIVSGGCSDGNETAQDEKPATSPPPEPRVADELRYPMILFAIDGLEWQVMKPLIEAGRLPVLTSLMKQGVYGYIETMTPTLSPVIWTSIATGKQPFIHGIGGYVYKVKNAGRIESRYYTSGHRRTKAFWNILSDYGLVVDCIGWWITYPAEKINGVMVSQTNTTAVVADPDRALWKGTLLEGVEGQVYPPERQNRVMDLLDQVDRSLDSITTDIFGTPPHPLTPFAQMMWDKTQWAFRADATYIRVALDLLQEGTPFDLLAIYIGGPDVAGHRFWRYAYPEEFEHPPSKDQIENLGHMIDDYYIYVDRSIGSLLAAAPENTVVMVVSDHGMHAYQTDKEFTIDSGPGEANSGHHTEGPPAAFIAAGGPFRRVGPKDTSVPMLGSVMDITPTLLAIKGIPIGDDMVGKPMTNVLDPKWLERVPIRRRKTHDTREWRQAQNERIREAVQESERLEQLRSLGYIK